MISKKTKLIFFGLILSGFFGFIEDSKAVQINLPQDANGWTIFTPSTDTRIMYVSEEGNDTEASNIGVYTYDGVDTTTIHPDWSNPFNPTGSIQTFATYAAAYANTRGGYPDWILIRRGDTFTEAIDRKVRSGRNATEPFLIGAYGGSGLSPLFKTGAKNGVAALNGYSWIVISGVSFYAHTRDPDGADYVSTSGGKGFEFQNNNGYSSQGILLEGCKFKFYIDNAIGPFTNSTGSVDGATIRRCVITDNYSESNTGHTQGIWSWHVENLIVEECILDHNGWYSSGGSIGDANALSHNTYFASTQNVTFRNNIFSRPSSGGNKFTAEVDVYGLSLKNNLYIDSEIAVSIGANFPDNIERFFSPEIANNVIVSTGLTHPTGTSAAWGVWMSGLVNGSVDSNLFIDNDVTQTNSSTIRFNNFNRDVTISNNIDIGQVNTGNSIQFTLSDGRSPSTGLTFSGNKIEASGVYGKFVSADDQILSSIEFTDNQWYSPTSTVFAVYGTTYSEVQWLSAVEPTAVFLQPSYADRTRNIPTYMTSIGEMATTDAFINAARNQDRYNWDTRFTAAVANNWVRAGFDMESINSSFRADVDNSSAITTTDALLTLRNSLELSMTGTAWQASATTGDVNCDGVSNSTDALLILRHSLGLSMSETGWCE